MRNLRVLLLFIGLFTPVIFCQNNIESLKSEAQQNMQRGKYGEAIDLLNKYISAKPKAVEGYTLRGLSYEKRDQLEYAVYDFRSAKKLAPDDQEVNKNLNRATNVWYAQLKSKIEGHRREIAINPDIPVNYLEIGKCYKHLGEWVKAEEWYDYYLKREEPSADEVIRYTEILAKNNHIEKGEKILKRFVEKYPKDHRLWSRYGYFTLWLGKKKIAAEAFREALKFRPYFKEAMDGLEIAEDRSYVYTYYDTTARHKEQLREKNPPEYPIDRYYRIVKANPKDSVTRFTLAEALYNVNRLEEAYEQLQILAADYNGQPRFTVLWDSVSAKRDRIMEERAIQYKEKFDKNPNDKEAALMLAEIHARKMDYDGAIEILKQYLGNKPTDQEIDVRFALARYSAWNYQFEGAIEQMNYLLAKDPNNLEYQLFRAQVAVWTWTDPEMANTYLDNVLRNNPKNIQALVSKATLYIRERNFPDALKLIEDGRRIKPDSKEIETAQNFYDVSLTLEEDRKNFEILVSARETAVAGDCSGSLEKYNEYFSKIKAPSKIELLEFADVNSCAKNYGKAIDVYNQILAEDYDYDVALLKAKATMWSGDSLGAREQFWKLVQEDSTNFDTKFYMAENYEHLKDYDSARAMYDFLLASAPDTVKRDLVQKRIGWLPSGGGGDSFLSNFPVFTRLAPTLGYYSDNQNLRMMNTSLLIEVGLLSNFSAGISLGRVFLSGTTINKYDIDSYFTTFKGSLFYYPLPNLYFTISSGSLSYQGLSRRRVEEFGFRYDKAKKWSLGGQYAKTDAAVVLYSATLADPNVKFDARTYKFDFVYNFSSIVKLTAAYNRLYISGGRVGLLYSQAKVGNLLTMRLGRKFMPELQAGYEYNYAAFSPQWDNPLYKFYYSPKQFEAHSIWGEYSFDQDEPLNYTAGLKLGYVPADDFLIRELSGGIEYKIVNSFVLSGKVTIGESYRETSSYQYASGFFSIYWSF